jgi:hypothetical protein
MGPMASPSHRQSASSSILPAKSSSSPNGLANRECWYNVSCSPLPPFRPAGHSPYTTPTLSEALFREEVAKRKEEQANKKGEDTTGRMRREEDSERIQEETERKERYAKPARQHTMKTPDTSDYLSTYAQSISSTQTITPSNLRLRTYYCHKRQWDRLHTEKSLKWDMFPWPLLKQPTTVEEITANGVEEYLRSLYQLQDILITMEEYVTDHRDRWDYNRMDAKVFRRINKEHQKKVEEGVIRVGTILLGILRNMQEPR